MLVAVAALVWLLKQGRKRGQKTFAVVSWF